MSVSSRQRPPSAPSTSSLNHTTSVDAIPPPPSIVITVPPWARDEPPSPKEHSSVIDPNLPTALQPSDASYNASVSDLNSRWWTFTLPRPTRQLRLPQSSSTTPRKSFRDFSWLPTSSSIREGTFICREKDPETAQATSSGKRNWGLSITLPTPTSPYTLSHNVTPGWDSPWSPRTAIQGLERIPIDDNPDHLEEDRNDSYESQESSTIRRARKNFRVFILTNTYVPLFFRFINIIFTTAALGIAIRIRRIEMDSNSEGAVGSSPTVVIIFAPLTLVHVMAAIYLEYFGRPLGLWRTSGKLTHTLSEVLFICAWSAALSLCFDNFFTSLVPCASPSSISWYNQLPRPPSPIPNLEGGLGDRLCDDQLALICLVGVGLSVYCINLVISLFRIFEKVKYHPAAPPRT
ncbi:hypothetical protein L208DRAFT_1307892 [Tricholoma matsutake]|nr:hypothetical protein L208DRAFT_1307892 [Tricholoma matsutake 945]